MIETREASPAAVRCGTRAVVRTTPFRCPSCRQGMLEAGDARLGAACAESLTCVGCGERFPVSHDGIPDLLRPAGDPHAIGHQAEHFDGDVDPEFEIERPRVAGALYQEMIESRFRRAIAMLPWPLAGRTVLDVCCGSGMGSEMYARRGAIVTGVDVSREALRRGLERARRRRYRFEAVLADATNLPWPDGAFDVVAVHDGLHHLERPELGIDEMARVARRAVVVLEPADSPITRWAIRHGLAEEIEESGNRIHRFRSGEVEETLERRGFSRSRAVRSALWYTHQPPRWFRWFDHPAAMVVAKVILETASACVGGAGNKITVVAWKPESGT